MTLFKMTAGPSYARLGVVAGCSLATSLIRVHAIDGIDWIRRHCPSAFMDVYID